MFPDDAGDRRKLGLKISKAAQGLDRTDYSFILRYAGKEQHQTSNYKQFTVPVSMCTLLLLYLPGSLFCFVCF